MTSIGCIDVDTYNELDQSIPVRTTNDTNEIHQCRHYLLGFGKKWYDWCSQWRMVDGTNEMGIGILKE